MKKLLILLFLPVSFTLQSRGQEIYSLSELQEEFFNAIFSLNLETAEDLLSDIREKDSIEAVIAKTQLLWWESISTGTSIKPLLQFMNETSGMYNEMPTTLAIHFNSMRLRVHTTKMNYFRVWKEWKIFEDNLEEGIKLCDHDTELFIRGIYHCMKAEIQRRMPLFIKDSINSYTNMELGISNLIKSTKSTNMVIRFEAHYFLMRVYSELHEQILSSIDHSTTLVSYFPENYIFCYYHQQYLQQADRDKEASKAIAICLEALEKSSLNPDQKRYGRELLLPETD